MSQPLILGRFSIGIGDRFAHQAQAQLRACQLALEQGVEIIPVWNKSNREHSIIGSEPSATRAAADAAVKALGWAAPHFLDADHIRLETVGRFLPHCDFYTIDVADFIGQPAAPEAVEAFLNRHPELIGTQVVPGIAEPLVTTRDDIRRIAVQGTAWVKRHSAPLIAAGTRLRLEYSPESFTSTELDFALEVCEAVTDAWGPTVEDKIILNLPATVEYATPNVHADQIEWMCRRLTRRDRTLVSLHTHNDRGTGVAATELALLAGADRVEGTLFGNGERTGNLDVVTVALNLYTHGIHPGLDFGDINGIREVYERCTRLEVPPRQPYAGELTFTAFSGSHQDAIKKSWAAQKAGEPWDVLYIPIDPADIGRSYKAIIRINSQSGKGGVAYVLEKEFGYQLPKLLQKELGRLVNDLSDQKGTELTAQDVHQLFLESFLIRDGAVALEAFRAIDRSDLITCEADLRLQGSPVTVRGSGNGPIDAFVQALTGTSLPAIEILNYSEHSLGAGAGARAISYIQIKIPTGRTFYGVGSDTNIELASIHAIISALNRAIA